MTPRTLLLAAALGQLAGCAPANGPRAADAEARRAAVVAHPAAVPPPGSAPHRPRPAAPAGEARAGAGARAEATPTQGRSTDGAAPTEAPEATPGAATGAGSAPAGAAQGASGAPAAPTAGPPAVVRNIGLHIGGGPNDAATKAPFQRAIMAHVAAFQDCHARHAPGARGSFGIDLLVPAPGGHATASSPRTALGDPAFRDCVVGAFEQVLFERPRRGATKLSFSLSFEPG